MLVIIILLFASISNAQMGTLGCLDKTGQAVQFVANDRLSSVAIAIIALNEQPTIIYNPTITNLLAVETQIYIFGYECALHALGHVRFGGDPTINNKADCYAMWWVVENYGMTAGTLWMIQTDLRNFTEKWAHQPGTERMVNLKMCLKD